MSALLINTMSLITQRAKHFNSVVGQDRVLKVLKAILKSDKFLLRGFIFEGVRGVGKTTTAYLAARALMCTGDDPEGCDKCASCKTIVENGIDAHPDFLEVDAASKAGVQDARDLVATVESLPVLGRRRVIMIDEAHCLSSEAWKVYLKPLEQKNNDAILFFVSNQGHKIPEEIRGRCCRLRFGKISTETILGFLANIAVANQITYELDALKAIARGSKGILREALTSLDICASIGPVTKELAANTLDADLEDTSVRIFNLIAARKQEEAVNVADEVCRSEQPSRLIESLFATYAKCVYRPETPEQQQVAKSFNNLPLVTNIFVKWSTPSQISSDTIPLLIAELLEVNEVRISTWTASRSYNSPNISVAPETATANEFAELTGAVSKR